jgi:hypothetical protein
MNSSDWLTIALTLLGILIGAGISWAFFRAQQQLSFSAFEQKLSEIALGVTTLRENIKLSDHIDVARELGAVRSAVDHLDSAVGSLVGKVVGEVREQQSELLRVVQAQFDRQVAESREVLRSSVVKELGGSPSAQDQSALVNRLMDLVTDALTAMGHYQRAAIEDQSQAILERVEERIAGAIGKVGDEVHEIREKLSALEPASFPALELGGGDEAA